MSATGHQLRRRLQAQREAAQAAQEATAPEPTGQIVEAVHSASVVDLRGNWMRKRAEVRDLLGMDRVPRNKDEAREVLEAAGYQVQEVTGGDA